MYQASASSRQALALLAIRLPWWEYEGPGPWVTHGHDAVGETVEGRRAERVELW
jgi:hypothetical protein